MVGMSKGRHFSQKTARTRKLLPEREVAFYNELSSRWWERGGPFYALRLYNRVRVPFIEDAVRRAYQRPVELASIARYMKSERQRDEELFCNKLALDVGCGGGLLAEALAIRGFIVTGIDASAEAIEAANIHRLQQLEAGSVDGLPNPLSPIALHGLRHLGYIHSDLGEIRERSRSSNSSTLIVGDSGSESATPRRDGFKEGFHIVVASEVIEHVDDPRHFMRECFQLLKPGGVFVLSTPNRTLISYLFLIFFAERVLQMVPQGTHQYSKFLRPQELLDIAGESCSFRHLKTIGTFYIPGIGLWLTTRCDWNSYMIALMKI